jgi:DNA-binding PadR family transcriptional regulator
MLAVARLGSDAYGAAIQKVIEEVAGREATIATIYVTLVRLENKGYVESRRESPLPVRGGKGKRCFRLTPKGVAALKEARSVLDRMWRSVEKLSQFKAR